MPRPEFFKQGGYETLLPPRAAVLVLPYGPAGWSMLWQAEAGFRFRIIGGHFALRATPPEEEWRDVYEALGTGRIAPARLRAFLDAHDVDAVILAPGTRWRMRQVLGQALGSPTISSHDALVYRLVRPKDQ